MIFLPALLALLLPLALCAPPLDIELGTEADDNLETFEENFHLHKVTDPVEKAAEEEALNENEKIVKKENEEYLKGNKTWHDALNKFSALTKAEFEAEKTGLKVGFEYARGLIMPTGELDTAGRLESLLAQVPSCQTLSPRLTLTPSARP